MNNFAIIGGGTWGTAIGIYLAKNCSEVVTLYLRNKAVVEEINKNKTNKKYFSDLVLPHNIIASDDLCELYRYKYIIISVASYVLLEVVRLISTNLSSNSVLILATKGIDRENNQLFSDAIKRIVPNSVVIMAGPSFAEELINEKYTIVTLACKDYTLISSLSTRMSSNYFFIYLCNDIITVQLAGVMKNIIAIASGVTQGLNYGVNYQSWLASEGINQVMMLAVCMGGEKNTYSQPAVMGDILLSSNSMKSRNRLFGYELVKSKNRRIFIKDFPYLVEGKENIFSLLKLSSKFGVKLSIPIAVAEIVKNPFDLESIAQHYLVEKLKSI